MSGFFWWSWKLLQHQSRKAWTDWCVRSPRLLLGQGMHETLSLKLVMTAFIHKLCWRFCCKFIQQLPWTPHTFSNFQYIFKITLHCTKVKHFATILFPTLNSWSNAGVPVTGTIFWMNVTLHQVNYILVPQSLQIPSIRVNIHILWHSVCYNLQCFWETYSEWKL